MTKFTYSKLITSAKKYQWFWWHHSALQLFIRFPVQSNALESEAPPPTLLIDAEA